MKLWQALCLFGIGFLLMAQCPLVQTESNDEYEDDEDSYVDIEKEEPAIARERPVYSRPVLSTRAHFVEPFDTRAEYLRRWVNSQAKKDGVDENVAKYDGKWEVEEPRENPISGDLGIVLKSKAKHHAVSVKLDRPYEFTGKPFVVQYEVKFQNGMDCGGAYIKLLSSSDKGNLKTFTDKTPYTIMFGPDKCGNDHKLHFIFRHKNPKTGEYEEKHAEKPTGKLDTYFSDKNTHLYTLVVNPDNSYEIKVDNKLISSGDLLNNVSPPVNPPKEIDDPEDKKSADWDDREKIPDPDATKPDDWDESEPAKVIDEAAVMPDGWLEDQESYIPDPEATKPDDWDDEMDGEWEAPKIDNPECASAPGCGKWERPTISNPNYKGKWKASMIDNPDYKGEWKPQRIANPGYFEDLLPYKMTPIQAVGLELWSMSDDILFDNFIVSDNLTLVDEFTALTWEVKTMEEKAASSTGGWWQAIKSSTEGRQWLWAVYVMVLLLPIMLLSICLCPKSGPVKPEDIDAHRKKFDGSTPDDDEGVEEKEGEEDEAAQGDHEPEDGKEEGEAEGAEEVGAAGDGAVDQDEADQDAAQDASATKSNSPRKRRARKE